MPTKDKPGSTKKKIASHRLVLRNLTPADYDDVKEIMDNVYSRLEGAWSKKTFNSQITAFPSGQLCIEDNGKVVAAAITTIVNYTKFGDKHSYDEITGSGTLKTHNAEGDTMYGVDVFVHPDYRDMRLGRRLYDARKQLCEELNLRRIIIGGRIPGYHKHRNHMSVQEYVRLVKIGEVYDPVLSFQLANEFHIRRIVKNYIDDDEESGYHAVLLEWNNIYYEEPKKEISPTITRSIVRIGAVQWQMRRVNNVNEMIDNIEYFVDAVAGYKADFCLFPEFFNGPLMGETNEAAPSVAIRHLARYTDQILEAMVRFSVAYNVNIIAGSMPVYSQGKLYNEAFLCRRDGTYASQRKLHITPDEKAFWGLQGGEDLIAFETDMGKIGILICYDVEFPELPRLLSEYGIQILFVPFWTDTKHAYMRVRQCAAARAIENELYVVITGSVGNLPKVANMDIQYSQAAVFSPSDFSFPHDSILAEATPNTEMTLITDLDLDLLKQMRYQGTVRNTMDRRRDLYSLRWVGGD